MKTVHRRNKHPDNLGTIPRNMCVQSNRRRRRMHSGAYSRKGGQDIARVLVVRTVATPISLALLDTVHWDKCSPNNVRLCAVAYSGHSSWRYEVRGRAAHLVAGTSRRGPYFAPECRPADLRIIHQRKVLSHLQLRKIRPEAIRGKGSQSRSEIYRKCNAVARVSIVQPKTVLHRKDQSQHPD